MCHCCSYAHIPVSASVTRKQQKVSREPQWLIGELHPCVFTNQWWNYASRKLLWVRNDMCVNSEHQSLVCVPRPQLLVLGTTNIDRHWNGKESFVPLAQRQPNPTTFLRANLQLNPWKRSFICMAQRYFIDTVRKRADGTRVSYSVHELSLINML